MSRVSTPLPKTRKRLLLAVGLLLVLPISAQRIHAENRLSVDEIVAGHVEARGGLEKIRAIRTLIYSEGRYREPGFTGSGKAFMAFARPYFRVVGNPESPGHVLEGYDGAAWEWYADPGIVVRTVGHAAGATRRGTDFEGSLIDYREKGHRVVLVRVAEVDGRPVYQLTMTTRDGFQREYFLDAETFLVVSERQTAPVHAFGDPVRSETRIEEARAELERALQLDPEYTRATAALRELGRSVTPNSN